MGKPSSSPWKLSGWALWSRTFLALALGLALFAFLYAPSPLIYDADSYYHLAVAKEYSEHGASDGVDSIRGGLLGSRFGDKEYLFHLILQPFVTWLGPSLGGRVALALLGALALTIVAHMSLRVLGSWGVLIPFWLVIGSTEFTWRLVRLRAELLALVLILLALWLAGTRRYRWLGVVTACFALSYTAIHAFVGIFVLIFLLEAWIERRWEWRLLIYPVLGALVGLLVHPQFPNNLAVWWFQNVEYFRFKGALDVGTEIRPNFTDVVLMVNLGWFLGLAILWRSTEPGTPRESSEFPWLSFGVGATVFGALYILMSRFSLYVVPLATLWLLFVAHRQGRRWTYWVRLPWRGRIPTYLAWSLCILISLPVAAGEVRRYRQRNSVGPDQARIADREAFGRSVPDGGRVAAPWRSTALYMFYAPQGRYLNVLDPVFLAAADPDAYRAQRSIFSGAEPDVPYAAMVDLDSSLIAYPATTGDPVLTERLLGDPRVEVLHRGSHWLFQIDSSMADSFVTDWRVVPPGSMLPAVATVDMSSWSKYPLRSEPAEAAVEGFVDASRVSASAECIAFAHSLVVPVDTSSVYELAPSGPATLWLDGDEIVRLPKGVEAVLGRGTELPLSLPAGEHRLTVLTCTDPESGRNGFYLLERSNEPSTVND